MNRGPQKRLFERNNRIVELRKQELSQREIAEIVGCSQETVGAVLRNAGIYGPSKHGITVSKESANKQDYQKLHDLHVSPIEKVIATVDCWSGGKYEYVSGYTRCDCKVIVRCKECGTTIERSFTTIRHGNKRADRCPVCEENKRAKEKEERDRAKEEAKKKKVAEERAKKQKTFTCKVCGEVFRSSYSRQKYCSPKCYRIVQNRTATAKKDKRVNKQNKVDRNIDLHALFNRDEGVCYICGKPCDWNDYTTVIGRDGRECIVAGDSYPSIEHVVPLTRGGFHAWENVKLAHRQCNYLKKDKMPKGMELPQWVQMSLFSADAPATFL